jgi:uncharacterized membrane protein
MFPIFIILDYFYHEDKKIDNIYENLLGMIQIFCIGVAIYFLFFPINWVNITQVIKGTFGSSLLDAGLKYILILFYILAYDLIKLQGIFLQRIKKQKKLLNHLPNLIL